MQKCMRTLEDEGDVHAMNQAQKEISLLEDQDKQNSDEEEEQQHRNQVFKINMA